jgi:hypothetical protein
VKLQIDYVLSFDSTRIKRSLKALPNNPNEAYCKIIERISRDMDFVRRILGWVMRAERILTMLELRHALVIQADETETFDDFDNEDKTQAREIVEKCGGLITHSAGGDLVTFSHRTVKSFLESDEPKIKTFLEAHQLNFPSHSEICVACLRYLALPPLQIPKSTWYPERTDPLKELAFGQYAASFWARHAARADGDDETVKAIVQTFESPERRQAAQEIRYGYCFENKTWLHFLVENRLAFLVMSKRFNDPSVENRYVSVSMLSD